MIKIYPDLNSLTFKKKVCLQKRKNNDNNNKTNKEKNKGKGKFRYKRKKHFQIKFSPRIGELFEL